MRTARINIEPRPMKRVPIVAKPAPGVRVKVIDRNRFLAGMAEKWKMDRMLLENMWDAYQHEFEITGVSNESDVVQTLRLCCGPWIP
jgi:hypothetical protein